MLLLGIQHFPLTFVIMKTKQEKGDEIMASNYIRFDWAMKRLLRNKANFGVLEGLLTTLLKETITIQKLLESESNQMRYW